MGPQTTDHSPHTSVDQCGGGGCGGCGRGAAPATTHTIDSILWPLRVLQPLKSESPDASRLLQISAKAAGPSGVPTFHMWHSEAAGPSCSALCLKPSAHLHLHLHPRSFPASAQPLKRQIRSTPLGRRAPPSSRWGAAHSDQGRREVERVRQGVDRTAQRVALPLRLALVVADHPAVFGLALPDGRLHRPAGGASAATRAPQGRARQGRAERSQLRPRACVQSNELPQSDRQRQGAKRTHAGANTRGCAHTRVGAHP